jgi:hypothetical protein
VSAACNPSRDEDSPASTNGDPATAAPSRTFDPATETKKLRDHLASHDKPIAFLLGAGASAAVTAADGRSLIPAVTELTARCQTDVCAIDDETATAWTLITDALNPARRNIEEVLSAVRRMESAITGDDRLVGLSRDQLAKVESVIQATIAREVNPAAERYPEALPHLAMGRWIRRIDRSCPVEIFTTNYDTLIEQALEQEWVALFDGFVGARRPFFSAASLAREPMAPGRRWTRLWKIHGSVTWSILGRDTPHQRIVRGSEQSGGELILPSLLKYDESRKQPYLAILDRLRRVLTDYEDAILITAGYSFGDEHINEVIFEALEANPRLHVFALCHSDPAPEQALYEAALRRGNILVPGRTQAIVGGQPGTWYMSDNDGPAAERMSGIFHPDEDGSQTGALALGDFNILCALLDSIAGGHG